MINKDLENSLDQRIKETLDYKADNISANTLLEIRNIRKMALQGQKTKIGFWQSLPHGIFHSTFFQWKEHSAFVTASMALLILFVVTSPMQNDSLLTIDNEINQVALTSDEIELYEKLEFYLWLQEFPEDHEQLS